MLQQELTSAFDVDQAEQEALEGEENDDVSAASERVY